MARSRKKHRRGIRGVRRGSKNMKAEFEMVLGVAAGLIGGSKLYSTLEGMSIFSSSKFIPPAALAGAGIFGAMKTKGIVQYIAIGAAAEGILKLVAVVAPNLGISGDEALSGAESGFDMASMRIAGPESSHSVVAGVDRAGDMSSGGVDY